MTTITLQHALTLGSMMPSALRLLGLWFGFQSNSGLTEYVSILAPQFHVRVCAELILFLPLMFSGICQRSRLGLELFRGCRAGEIAIRRLTKNSVSLINRGTIQVISS